MNRTFPILTATLALSTLLGTTVARAVAPLDPQFEGVDVDNRLGKKVDSKAPFTSSSEATTSLSAFLDGKGGRPVLLTLNYYRCDSLCSQQLNELLIALTKLGWAPGEQKFRIVTVSFDPSDTVEIARGKQETYRRELVRALAEARDEDEPSEADIAERAKGIDWTFLVGDDRSVRTLTSDLGYWFRFDEATRQYAHAPVIYVLSPEGVITRYLWGLEIVPQDLEFATMEASDGLIGGFGKKLLMSCFVFEDGKYKVFAWGVMRIGAGLVALFLGIWLFRWWRRERRRKSGNDKTSIPQGPVGTPGTTTGPGTAAVSGQGV
ncbi:MAG: SCO family protein [Deltaproteobacteria bacterium]|nr:SCO family protein [Deltaproteobacteria bacterium]